MKWKAEILLEQIYRGDLGMSLGKLLLIEQTSEKLGGGDFGTTYL